MKSFFLRISRKALILVVIILAFANTVSAKDKIVAVTSPDGKAVIRLDFTNTLLLSVEYNKQQIMMPSAVSMNITEYPEAFINPIRSKVITRKVSSEIIPPVAEKRSHIPDVYNETEIWFKGNYGIAAGI